ncbi:hypothetical protein TEQG_04393 [Trichophyton equinum CBS 127.97]|uniref:Uncharacterized protein n=1 Tax=Trichophyton equinum (strain ATCC MYA-4606 / CBS 127.97) TaxID=559882 RepID=F2PTL8_TRIEC|nr:hypothetical protein TEQG_04393 [Trichophyton equinum CBS 127.97]
MALLSHAMLCSHLGGVQTEARGCLPEAVVEPNYTEMTTPLLVDHLLRLPFFFTRKGRKGEGAGHCMSAPRWLESEKGGREKKKERRRGSLRYAALSYCWQIHSYLEAGGSLYLPVLCLLAVRPQCPLDARRIQGPHANAE